MLSQKEKQNLKTQDLSVLKSQLQGLYGEILTVSSKITLGQEKNSSRLKALRARLSFLKTIIKEKVKERDHETKK